MNKIQNMIFARQKTPLLQPQAVVFITGCSSGIGNMLAQLLLEKGYKVVFTARKPAQIAQHLQDKYPQTSLCLHCDVTNQDTIKAAVQETVLKFGGIDVLINNAGVGYYGILESADISTIRNLFEVNVFGALRMIQEVLPLMRKDKKGLVVNISSLCSLAQIYANGLYAASKAALDCISESLQQEIQDFNIKVLNLNLGETMSSFYRNSTINTYVPIGYNVVISHLLDNFKQSKYYNPQDCKKALYNLIRYLETSADISNKVFLGNETQYVVNAHIKSIKNAIEIRGGGDPK